MKGFNPKSATFRQHYYPEGGWGWIVIFCAAIVHVFTSGIQMSYGVIFVHVKDKYGKENLDLKNEKSIKLQSDSLGKYPNFVMLKNLLIES